MDTASSPWVSRGTPPSHSDQRSVVISRRVEEDWWPLACESRASREVVQGLHRYARAPHPILILGETGTGKHQVARRLAKLAGADPLLEVLCPATFARDAAMEGRVRVLRDRQRGQPAATWHLQRVDVVPLSSQGALLRFVEQTLAGGVRGGPPVIATSDVGLPERVDRGRYTAELFYQLGMLTIRLPSLRERHEDLPLLMETCAVSAGVNLPPLTDESMAQLASYLWPGNLLELRNLVVQLAICLGDRPRIDIEQLRRVWFPRDTPTQVADDGNLNLEDAETRLILTAVERSGGNKTAAARDLGITPRTLHNKMQKYRRLGLVD